MMKQQNKNIELAKNTAILTVGKICTQFVTFMLLPLYTALLSPDEFGIVDLFNTYITVLVPIFNWQFENGMFRFMLECRSDKSMQKELFSTVFVTNILQGIIYILFFLVCQRFIHSEFKIFLALDVVANIFLNTLLQLPRGLGKNLQYSIASFLSATVTVVLNVLFIAGFGLGAYGMFLATLISKIITIIYLVISIHVWELFSLKKYNKNIFKKVAGYSFPLIPNSLSWWVINTSDRTVISFFIDITANGIYSVANKFSSFYITIYNIFNLSWTESVSLHINDDDSKDFFSETTNAIFNLFSALCFGIIAFIPFAFPLMINVKYQDAYFQIPILMLAVLFQVIVGQYSAIYVALKKSSEIAKTSFMAAVINIAINLLLIKPIGLYAASVSTLASFASMAVYRYFHVKKYMNIPLKKKNIFSALFVGILSVLSYYYNHVITNAITLVIVVIYAYSMNKGVIYSAVGLVIKKIREIKNDKF